MRLVDPDVLQAAQGLSPGAAGFLLLVGLMLWVCGWRWHRFWVVFGITLAAGIVGLTAGRSAGGQVMVVGVLAAVTAGLLALEIARLLAFVTGGTTAWIAAQMVLPGASELWAVFLSGGLLGVSLYRIWTMVATSFLGGLISTHAALILMESLQKGFVANQWANNHSAALNGAVVAGAIIGLMLQARLSPAHAASPSQAGKSEKPKNHKLPADAHSAPAATSEGGILRFFPSRNRAA